MQVAEPGLTDGVRADRLRVNWGREGLGEGQGASGGGGGEGGPSWNRCHLRSSAVSSGLPSGTLCAHLCRQAFIERWVGGPSTEQVMSAQGGRTHSSALALGFLDGLLSLH